MPAKIAASSGVLPPSFQSWRGQAHRDRLVRRPHGADGAEHFEREARAVLHGRRHIRRRADWSAATGSSTAGSRARSAARASRSRVPAARLVAATKSAVTRSMSWRVMARGTSECLEIGDRRGRDQRPGAFRQRLVDAFPGELGRALAAGMAKLDADLGAASGRARSRRSASRRRPVRRSTGRGSRA